MAASTVIMDASAGTAAITTAVAAIDGANKRIALATLGSRLIIVSYDIA